MIDYTIANLRKILKPIEGWKHRESVCACGVEFIQRAPMQIRCADCAKEKRVVNQKKSRDRAKARRQSV